MTDTATGVGEPPLIAIYPQRYATETNWRVYLRGHFIYECKARNLAEALADRLHKAMYAPARTQEANGDE